MSRAKMGLRNIQYQFPLNGGYEAIAVHGRVGRRSSKESFFKKSLSEEGVSLYHILLAGGNEKLCGRMKCVRDGKERMLRCLACGCEMKLVGKVETLYGLEKFLKEREKKLDSAQAERKAE